MRVTLDMGANRPPGWEFLKQPPLDMPHLLGYYLDALADLHPEAGSVMLLWNGLPIFGRMQ